MVIYEILGGTFVACLIVLGIFKLAEIIKGRKANADSTPEHADTAGGTPDGK